MGGGGGGWPGDIQALAIENWAGKEEGEFETNWELGRLILWTYQVLGVGVAGQGVCQGLHPLGQVPNVVTCLLCRDWVTNNVSRSKRMNCGVKYENMRFCPNIRYWR